MSELLDMFMPACADADLRLLSTTIYDVVRVGRRLFAEPVWLRGML